MDICIGGPWDAAKVLKNEIYERNFFKVKIKGSNTVTTYKKYLHQLRALGIHFGFLQILVMLKE